jgi:hypothetical protein
MLDPGMTGRLLATWLVLMACGKGTSTGERQGPFGAAPGPGDGDEPPASCATGCTKVLGCLGTASAQDQEECIGQCEAGGGGNLAKAMEMSCDEIAAWVQQQQPKQRTCNADCATCAGDGESCYAVAGGSHGIPCDPCCCEPGGGARVWK